MFTLNAKLIEQAAATGNPRDLSNALANCAAPLQHRGPMSNSGTPGGYALGGFDGAHAYPEGYAIGGPQVDLNFINIEIPPWQNIPFTPTPLVDMASFWSNSGDTRWPAAAAGGVGAWGGDPTGAAASGGDRESLIAGGEPALAATGSARLGDTTARSVSTGTVRSSSIRNRGDLSNSGRLSNTGNVTVGVPAGGARGRGSARGGGNVTIHGDTHHHGPVTNSRQVVNRQQVDNTFVTNNQTVNTYGPTNSFSTLNTYAPVNFYSPVYSHSTSVFRNDAFFDQDFYVTGDSLVGNDLIVRNNLLVENNTTLLGAVQNTLGAGDTFVINRPENNVNVTLLQVATARPATATIQNSRWLNVYMPTFLGGDTHLWRNYLYVSTAGDANSYTKLTLQKVDFVTDVTWADNTITVQKTPYWVLAKADGNPANTAILECPI